MTRTRLEMPTSRVDVPKAVLLDLDGTLVATTYVHTMCWWQALRDHGQTVPMARLHRAVGMGSDHMLDHVLGADRDRRRDHNITGSHGSLFTGWYERIVPLPGARDLLKECSRRGISVVIASSASEDDLTAMRRVIAADNATTATTSSADAQRSKPDRRSGQRL